MKNILKLSFYSITAMFMLLMSSCDDSSELFVVDSTPTAAILAGLNITDIDLDAVNVNNPAATFSWSAADYGLQASVVYSLQFASDEAFTEPYTATTVTGSTTVTLNVNEMNTAAGNSGLPAFSWNTLYARVVSALGTQNSQTVNSNVVNFRVRPYFNYVFEDYYLVGNATAPSWNNNSNNPPLFRDPNNADEFTFIGYFNKGAAGDFNEGRWKVLETKGLWQPQWGVTDNEGSDNFDTSGDIAGNPGTQGGDPGRFGILTSGNYKFTINFATLKFSIEEHTAGAVANPTTLAIEGTGIASSMSMMQQSFDSNMWYANNVRLVPGEVAFMANGSSAWGSSTAFSGTATAGGGNIPVLVEDDYDVWFNALTGQYMLIPLNL